MKTDFNGLRLKIAKSFNQLAIDIGNISYIDATEQENLTNRLHDLRHDLWSLMCVYIEEKDRDFCDTVKMWGIDV